MDVMNVASRALSFYRYLGWKGDKSKCTVKVIHPKGFENFEQCGGAFIDIDLPGTEEYERLCVLFPGQELPLHHHEQRTEVFLVVGGGMLELPHNGRPALKEGDFLAPPLGHEHGLKSKLTGVSYVGVCGKEHLVDVHWSKESRDVRFQPLTALPGSQVCEDSPEELWWCWHQPQDLSVKLNHARQKHHDMNFGSIN
jgi:quercetin dioxygenase-like cupin family protein